MTNTYNIDTDTFNLICNDIEDQSLRNIIQAAICLNIDNARYVVNEGGELDIYATFDNLVTHKESIVLDIIKSLKCRESEMHDYLLNAINNENTLMYSHDIDLSSVAKEYSFDTKEFVNALYAEELYHLEGLIFTGKKIFED